ncbi:MAG: glycosyltransferase family 2 protein [Melioribacteraceae bacterium]|nr:glycosyltransferase family 2 protein [Melioribacteraceae bacterium]
MTSENQRQNNNPETVNSAQPKVNEKKAEGQNVELTNTPPLAKKKPYKRPRRNYNKNRGYLKRFSFKKVSILVPLFNEEESLKPLYAEIKDALKKIYIDYEILFFDDGSTDSSLEIIKELAKKDPKIKYISFRKNYGKSAALQLGFKAVTGDAVITMDADLQDDPAEIPNLLAKLDEGYDLVSGWKKVRHDPFIKKHSSKFFNYITRLFSGIKIHDFNCGLKGYRSETVKSIELYGELHRYIPVLAGWKGYKVTETVVRHHPRKYGVTKFGISRFFKGFIDLISLTFTLRYIRRPMHLFGFMGATAFFIGFLISAYLSYDWFVNSTPLSNRPLLALGMLLIVVGLQFFSVGLLGEFMAHNSHNDDGYSIKDQKYGELS